MSSSFPLYILFQVSLSSMNVMPQLTGTKTNLLKYKKPKKNALVLEPVKPHAPMMPSAVLVGPAPTQ